MLTLEELLQKFFHPDEYGSDLAEQFPFGPDGLGALIVELQDDSGGFGSDPLPPLRAALEAVQATRADVEAQGDESAAQLSRDHRFLSELLNRVEAQSALGRVVPGSAATQLLVSLGETEIHRPLSAAELAEGRFADSVSHDALVHLEELGAAVSWPQNGETVWRITPFGEALRSLSPPAD